MHLLTPTILAGGLTVLIEATCWTSPLGILLNRPPHVGMPWFGPPPNQQSDCNLPLANGGSGGNQGAGGTKIVTTTVYVNVPGPTVTACTATISACTATAYTTTTTISACTSTTTSYAIHPTALAEGTSVCVSKYGNARPTPIFNAAGQPRCCAPIFEKDAACATNVAKCRG